MSKPHLITGTIAATAAALALSACSSSGTSPAHSLMPGGMTASSTTNGSSEAGAPATGPHNAADIAFATDMIPHHAQALEMAKMALATSTDSQVKQLAQMIEGEQTPEIKTMSGWLRGWNTPVPSTSMGSTTMGGASMPGMMSDADMTKLGAATGAAFDKLFLSQMITHHSGALVMAITELGSGHNNDVRALAKAIVAGQSKEITKMKTLLPTIR